MAKKSGPTAGIFNATTRTAATRVGDMTYIKHDKFIGRSLGTYGEWAQIEIDALLRYVAAGDFVIDVGANIGFHALSFARKVGKSGVVWAFEPDPVNGLVLRHNIIQTGLDDVVIPFDLALSDSVGLCRFRTHPITTPENFGHTGIDAQAGDYPRVSVPLDVLSHDRAPALIKIDIEGHELPALDGMTEIIERYSPVLSIEADTPEEIEANAAYAAALGYDVYSLIVNAFNPGNFAENPADIWNGHGRCANLLCVVPGKHAAPEGLDLVRRADVEKRAIARMGKSAGAAYSSLTLGDGPSGEHPIHTALGASQADIKRFVSGFLKTTYGKLDPVTDAALVNGALDFLAANGPAAEGIALQRLIVAGVESFAEALGGRTMAVDLAETRAERDRLREELLVLEAGIKQLGEEREQREAQHLLALEDVNSRLLAANAAEVRLAAEFAHQGERARRDLVTAQASFAEVEALNAQLAEDLAAAREQLAARDEERDRLADELAELQTRTLVVETLQAELTAMNAEQARLAEECSGLAEALRAANEVTTKQATDLADLQVSKEQLVDAMAQLEQERDKLSSELSEAHGRLSLQAQQLRHFRTAKG